MIKFMASAILAFVYCLIVCVLALFTYNHLPVQHEILFVLLCIIYGALIYRFYFREFLAMSAEDD